MQDYEDDVVDNSFNIYRGKQGLHVGRLHWNAHSEASLDSTSPFATYDSNSNVD